MSRPRGARPREPSGPGLPALAAAAVGLALAGFAVGAGAGLLWEAPGLVTAHLLGRSEEVPLTTDATPQGASDETAVASEARPLGSGAGEEAPPSVSARAREPATERAGGSPRAGGFAVQVGAFAEEAGARELAERLRTAGFSVYVLRAGGGDAAPHRVRVGPLGSREEAERAADRLERERDLPTWVLSREGE